MRIKNINKRNGEKVNKSNYPPHFENRSLQNAVKSKKAALKSESEDALSDGFLLRCC